MSCENGFLRFYLNGILTTELLNFALDFQFIIFKQNRFRFPDLILQFQDVAQLSSLGQPASRGSQARAWASKGGWCRCRGDRLHAADRPGGHPLVTITHRADHCLLYVYQLYKNRHHGMAMLPRARDIDDVAPTRPAPNQTLAATPTLTMAVPLPCREAGLMLCRSWMAWGWLSKTPGRIHCTIFGTEIVTLTRS